MIVFGISGIVAGLALGLRFKVFVLVPVLMIAVVTAIVGLAVGLASVDRLLSTLLWFSLGLQFGYLSMSVAPAKARLASLARPTKA